MKDVRDHLDFVSRIFLGRIQSDEGRPEHCVAVNRPSETNFSWFIFSAKLKMKCLKSGNLCAALAGVLKYSTRTSVS